MKPGTRALGIAESHTGGPRSTVAGAVVRADRVLDGLVLSSLDVGGLDATDVYTTLVDRLDRPDVQYLLLSGVAPAWFNLVDLPRLADATGLPTVAVSFEASAGLDDALAAAFSSDELARRRAIYDRLPPRHPVALDEDRVFVRAVGLGVDEAARVVRAFTPEGGRPEPLRVARLVARTVDTPAGS